MNKMDEMDKRLLNLGKSRDYFSNVNELKN